MNRANWFVFPAVVAAFCAGLWMLRGDAALVGERADPSASPRTPQVAPGASDILPTLPDGLSVRTDLALPRLDMAPEVYAQLAENPFRCGVRPADASPCDWRFDHLVAKSPAEARWMSAYGYPTTDEREQAARSTTEALVSEAKRAGSPALWALALQRKVDEATDSEDAERHARTLRRLAEQGRSLYALEQAALASMHVADLILAEAADPAVRDSRTGSVEFLMERALRDVAMAAALGDPGAMVRVLQRAPVDLPRVYGEPLNNVSPAYAAEMIQNAIVELRENQALADRGALSVRNFTVADIAPRPTPVLVRNNVQGDVWTGER